jgi:hypothetical protein
MGTPISGTAGSVAYTTGGTTVVGEISEWSLDISMSPTEVSAFGDNWKRSIPSIRSAGGSFSGNFAGDETAQTSLRSAVLGGSAIALRLYEGTAYWNIGTAYVTNLGRTLSHQGKAEVSYDFEPSGPVTYVG